MRRVVSGTGKVLITLGILILLFVAYQLWGTGIYTARAQNKLESQFEETLRQSAGTAHPSSRRRPPRRPGARAPPRPRPRRSRPRRRPDRRPEGDAVAHIVIPKIGVDWFVVRRGRMSRPPRRPRPLPVDTLPGQKGNAAIAGHRTTYGAPFGDLDELEAGDEIEITTVQGTFTYTVYDKFDGFARRVRSTRPRSRPGRRPHADDVPPEVLGRPTLDRQG